MRQLYIAALSLLLVGAAMSCSVADEQLTAEDLLFVLSRSDTTTTTTTTTDWVGYSLTPGGTTTAPTKATGPVIDQGYWRRIGDSMQIRYEYSHAANAGATAGTGTYLFPLPTGYTIDSTKVDVPGTATVRNLVGVAAFDGDDGTVGVLAGGVSVYDSSNLFLHGSHDTAQVILGSATTPWTSAMLVISFYATVPIVEFATGT